MQDNTNESHENGHRFLRYQMQAVAKHILPNNRVGICLRHQIEKYGTVDVFKHRQTQKAFYGGLMVCGSVWICPVCASKISERRRAELKHASSSYRKAGGNLTMLTLTFSHSRSDKLDDSLKALGQAVLKFRSGKRYDALRKEMGLVGSVRAMEITYGKNGWHPHFHILNFHEIELDPWERLEYEERFYDLWSAACMKFGLRCSKEHGLKLDDATEADQYIGKWGDLIEKQWGIDSEMTKSHIKKGKEEGLTPFDFLRKIVEDGDLEYAMQYKEYAAAMKGKTQLKWSRGLKQKFAIEDKTDEQIAESKEEPADLLGGLTWQDWRYIIRNNYRAKLLDYIELYGFEEALQRIGLDKKNHCYNEQ
ncbi:protein rep [Paenibacillus alvei]|uniref:protein rep n=1 Tax=Paenibacillus alvei TaxID=44250 RepID=UPI00227E00E8|nr:protein rep [Paenibacillus alvei]MCY9758333.1 protein rep [Paenibacillus alvei]